MSPKNMYPIEKLEKALGAKWVNLNKARKNASDMKQKLTSNLSSFSTTDTSIVVFGSLARNEYTKGSDIDWTLLIDGRANSKHLNSKHNIRDKIGILKLTQPGQEGIFGNLAFSHDIIHKIGGEDDTNKNITQRILLLLESTSIGEDKAYNRVLKEILNRYINEEWGLVTKNATVPRFLLNDIVRYWRTVAVDFAYKRRERQGKGWALRTIKLRMSRKLTFASGLIACFSCAMDAELKKKLSANRNDNKAHSEIMVKHLFSFVQQTPLDMLASIVLQQPELHAPAKQVIGSYDQFIKLLSDRKQRDLLEKLSPEAADGNPTFQEAKRISDDFQKGLDLIFLENNVPELYKLTKEYGVF